MKIGILSDTHGILNQSVIDAFQKVDHIIHAGDIGRPEIIESLKHMAPVTTVLGNTDREEWAQAFPASEMISLNGKTIYVVHDLQALDLDPSGAGIDIIISGHTHTPEIKTVGGTLYLNPGSASYRRRGNPLSVGLISLNAHSIRAEVIILLEK